MNTLLFFKYVYCTYILCIILKCHKISLLHILEKNKEVNISFLRLNRIKLIILKCD